MDKRPTIGEVLNGVTRNYRKELLNFVKKDQLYGFHTHQEIMEMDMDMDLFKTHQQGKLVIVGEGAVGKTSFLYRATRKKEDMDNWWYGYGLFFDNYSYKLENVTIELCDTAGQEDYDQLRPLTYPNTDIFLLAYSVLKRETFQITASKFILEVRRHVPQAICVLVACKIDLRTDTECIERLKQKNETPITFEEGMKMARDLNCVSFWETSSKTEEGFENIGDFLTRLYYVRHARTSINEAIPRKSKKCLLQ